MRGAAVLRRAHAELRTRASPGLPGETRAVVVGIPARRIERHRRAGPGAQDERAARTAGRRGESPGRQRHHRHRVRREVRARRLHVAAGKREPAGDQPAYLLQAALRHARRLRADYHRGDDAGALCRASVAAGKVAEGAGRSRPLAAGQALVRFRRQRRIAASRHRAVQDHREGERPARALQGRGAGHHRSRGRPRATGWRWICRRCCRT